MTIATEIILARQSIPPSGALTVRPLRQTAGGQTISIAIDHERLPLLAVPIPDDEPAWSDTSSQGLTVTTVDGTLFGSSARRALVRCTHAIVEPSFTAFAADLVAALESSTQPVVETCVAVLARWKSLLASASSPYLGEKQVMGLLAELHALEDLAAATTPAAALSMWTGPKGAMHDFQGSGGDLEVKATANLEQRSVHINGLHQLDAPAHGPLHLYVEVMTPSAQGDSLPRAIDRVLAAGASPADLFELLAGVGYQIGHADHYAQVRFDVVTRATYLVDDTFPRLTPTSLRDAAMIENVTRVEYTLSLAGVRPLEGDTTTVAVRTVVA